MRAYTLPNSLELEDERARELRQYTWNDRTRREPRRDPAPPAFWIIVAMLAIGAIIGALLQRWI